MIGGLESEFRANDVTSEPRGETYSEGLRRPSWTRKLVLLLLCEKFQIDRTFPLKFQLPDPSGIYQRGLTEGCLLQRSLTQHWWIHGHT